MKLTEMESKTVCSMGAGRIALPGYDVEAVSEKGERKAGLGAFWNRQYFPCFSSAASQTDF